MVYQAEKAIRDGGDKVPADVKKEVEEKIKAVKDVQGKDDKVAIETASRELSTSMQKIGAAAYKDVSGQAGPNAGAAGAGPNPAAGSGDGPVEGEVVDEKK
jgi:molecular chaperone DnaK